MALRQRWAERLASVGVTLDDVIARGALPVVERAPGERRLMRPTVLERCLGDDKLALYMLGAIVGGELRAPAASHRSALPPQAVDWVGRF